MTRVVSRALQPICTSTALGKDWIPRLSVSAFEHMRDDMVLPFLPLPSRIPSHLPLLAGDPILLMKLCRHFRLTMTIFTPHDEPFQCCQPT